MGSMSRYVLVKPITWVGDEPRLGNCIGVCIIPDEGHIPLNKAWWNCSFKTITKPEYETLLAFDFPILDLTKEPPEEE